MRKLSVNYQSRFDYSSTTPSFKPLQLPSKKLSISFSSKTLNSITNHNASSTNNTELKSRIQRSTSNMSLNSNKSGFPNQIYKYSKE